MEVVVGRRDEAEDAADVEGERDVGAREDLEGAPRARGRVAGPGDPAQDAGDEDEEGDDERALRPGLVAGEVVGELAGNLRLRGEEIPGFDGAPLLAAHRAEVDLEDDREPEQDDRADRVVVHAR